MAPIIIWQNSIPFFGVADSEDDFKNKDMPKKDGAPKNKDDAKNERSILPGSFFQACYQQATASTHSSPHSAVRHF